MSAATAFAAPSGGGPQITTTDPDVVSARITQGASTTQVSRVELCYDQALNATADNGGANFGTYYLEGYDAGNVVGSTNSRVIVDRPNCVEIDFGAGQAAGDATPGLDVASYTIAVDPGGAGTDLAGRPTLQGSAALEGSRKAPRLGNTAGPDLVGTPSVDTTNNTITYTFDEPLIGAAAGNFGYYTGSGIAFTDCGATVVNGNQVRAQFGPMCGDPTLSSEPPVRFFVLQGGAFEQNGDTNPDQHAGGGTANPELQSVVQTGPNEFELKYDRPVVAGFIGNIVAYTEDGQTAFNNTSFSRPGSDATVLRVTFQGVQGFNEKIVGIADQGGGAVDLEVSRASSVTYIPFRAANMVPGFSDAPDLQSVTLNRSNNTATFRFDQIVDPNAVNVGGLRLIDNNGNQFASPSGTANSVNGRDVVVQFTGTVLDVAVGGTADESAVCDFEANDPSGNKTLGGPDKPVVFGGTDPDSDCNPLNTVRVGAPAGQPTTSGTSTTPSGTTTSGTSSGTSTTTTTTGTTGTGTTTTGTVTRRAPASVTIRVRPRRDSRPPFSFRASGRVNPPSGLSQSACASRALVSVQTKIRTRTISTRRARLRSNCTYSLRVTIRQRIRVRQAQRAGRLRMRARFGGNAFMLPRSSRVTSMRTR